MKKPQIMKKVAIALTGLVAGVMMSSAAVSAIPYQGDQTVASPVPAFNVFTGDMPAPAPANTEADFFQGRVPANGNLNDPTTPYSDPVSTTCTNGEIVQLHVYVHNGAAADQNDNGTGPSIAHGTKVAIDLKNAATVASTTFDPSATISATNAASVSDGLTINCGGKSVELQYVPGSASQFSNGSGVLPLSDSIVSSGALIQSEKTPGDVWGCWNERVYVVLSVKVVVPPVVVPPTVSAMCTFFGVTSTADRKVMATNYATTAQNATFKSLVINFGYNGATKTYTSIADVQNDITNKTVLYQYPDDNSTVTYNVTTTTTYVSNVDGKTLIVSSPSTCAQNVIYKANTPPIVTPPSTPPVVTPPAPTSLVNTGPGSVVAIFGLATIAGTFGYRRFLTRRSNS